MTYDLRPIVARVEHNTTKELHLHTYLVVICVVCVYIHPTCMYVGTYLIAYDIFHVVDVDSSDETRFVPEAKTISRMHHPLEDTRYR